MEAKKKQKPKKLKAKLPPKLQKYVSIFQLLLSYVLTFYQRTEETKPSPSSASDKHKWAAVAAKHFDRTGQRITIEQARKMAESAT